jgi:hypothetical protein
VVFSRSIYGNVQDVPEALKLNFYQLGSKQTQPNAWRKKLMGRMRDIRRGARLNEALTNYKAYLGRSISTALPTYSARPPAVPLQIQPFGLEMPSGSLARVNGNETWSTINAATGVEAATNVAVAGANAKELRGFRPARITWFRNSTKTVRTGTSKFTLQNYRKYEGDSFSMPFGQKTGTDREFDVADKLKTALKAIPGFVVNRVSISPEMIRSR